ncbi:MAG: enamine deaminase RidA [Burkholderiales bacterium]|jgi:enamine deaminase RidA (YjgF/YER057c/UK114 family)|nr:MAG: enamine deaminase RidA [Burkholderiales bacterium]
MHKNVLQPPGWTKPRGYANGIAARGTVVSVAGQVGWNERCEFETDDFVGQVRQALANVRAVLAEAGGGPEHIVRMNWYMTDRNDYLTGGKALGAAYKEFMTDAEGTVHYPAMTAVQVVALMEPRAKIEIEVTAVVPIAM